MDSSDDVIARLGYLVLGTRLKRLAEQLQSGVAEMLVELGSPLQPGQLPLLVAIDQGNGLTVAQLVQALGTSQPAVSRTLAALQRANLVTLDADERDARIRRPLLTAKARQLLDAVRSRLFPAVARAAEQLCDGLDVLDILAAIEERNREQPFARRIRVVAAA